MKNKDIRQKLAMIFGQASAFRLLDGIARDPDELVAEIKAAKETGLMIERSINELARALGSEEVDERETEVTANTESQVRIVYMTTDHKVHESRSLAEEHQQCLDARNQFTKLLERFDFLGGMSAVAIADAIVFTDLGPRMQEELNKLFKG